VKTRKYWKNIGRDNIKNISAKLGKQLRTEFFWLKAGFLLEHTVSDLDDYFV